MIFLKRNLNNTNTFSLAVVLKKIFYSTEATKNTTKAPIKRSRKGTTNEKTLPNLFASDLSIDSPFGPTLINDLKVGDVKKSKETIDILRKKYFLDEQLIEQTVSLTAGCLEFQPDSNDRSVNENGRKIIPIMYLSYPSIAANQLLNVLVEHVSNSLSTEILDLNSKRIVQMGKAVNRFIKSNGSSLTHLREDDYLNKLQQKQEMVNNHLVANNRLVSLSFGFGRSQIKDIFLPGLEYIIKSLCTHSSTLPKIILIKDLPTFFESIESKRVLQDWIHMLYSNDAEMPPIMLMGYDCLGSKENTQSYTLPIVNPDPPNIIVDPIEMDVYRYRLAQTKIMNGIVQRMHDEGNNTGPASRQKDNIPKEISKIWIPTKPIACQIEEGIVQLSITPPIGPREHKLFEQQIQKDESEIIFKWNWIQLIKAVESQKSSLIPPKDIVNLLSKKLLHEDEITSIILLSKGKIYGTSNETPSTKDLFEALRMHYNHQSRLSPIQHMVTFDFSNLSKHEMKFANSLVQPEKVNVKFDDIGALDSAKTLLKEVIAMPIRRPDLYSVGILKEPISGVLLFGPPGTGKSLLAKAVASECGASFISVNLSNIFDMWVGEGEKNVKGLFSLARKISPCVIFIDEVDALMQTRTIYSVQKNTSLEVLNEFMSEWDGINSNQNGGIVIMGATNRPFALDDAVLRRLPRRILIDLPDEQARLKILQIILKEDTLDNDVNLDVVAQKTKGYSGSDLKNICKTAAFSSRRRETLIISMSDLESALKEISPSISNEMQSISMIRDWNEKFGEGAERKKTDGNQIGF